MILFDGTAMDCPLQRSRGIGRYVRSLHDALVSLRAPELQVLRLGDVRWPSLQPTFEENGADWRKALSRSRPLREVLASVDGVYHANELANLPDRPPRAATIGTIYDIIPLEYPDHYLPWLPPFHRWLWTWFVPRRIRDLDMIVTISKSIRDKLCDRFNLPEDRIMVISPGLDHLSASSEPCVDQSESSPYFLYVGGSDYRKNLHILLGAFAILASSYSDVRLIIAGQHSKKAIEALAIVASRLGIIKKVEIHGFVDDVQLQSLTRSAIATVIPSLSEGFGLPVLEAMSQGCPVVASDIPVFREIVHDGALLVDSTSKESLAEGMQRMMDDTELTNHFRCRGPQIASRFRWETSAIQHAKLYDRLSR